ncbi:shikimate kinase [Paraliobacillus quinghaiensis]|uniref:Shikimate kinase n=1 Tax=Paraliobacillus quinghaiensis TaxID=470815 RepID=A0A917WTU0_9BACI|nr:shikimate kinase [Paraliobacillus quinghaiensis]GGM31661.1 shikimate kinase [Paraliobacillus quinghaiensis]
MDSIYLIGFMGSGKTTVAKWLAEKLQLPLQDTDDMVEQAYGMKISDIFEAYGEETFRTFESQVLTQTKTKDCIVSTGGGIIERDINVNWLQNKQVIYLQTSWDVIFNRLKNDATRPIWSDQKKDKQALLRKRESTYLQVATYTVPTDGKTVEQIGSDILDLIYING